MDVPDPSSIVASVTIMMDKTSLIYIDAPIENRLLCLGMLEMAKALVNDHHAKKDDSMVKIPKLETGQVIRNLRDMSKKLD